MRFTEMGCKEKFSNYGTTGRVAVKTEPYPGRWTTHIVISKMSDLDEELFAWVVQAYEFSEKK